MPNVSKKKALTNRQRFIAGVKKPVQAISVRAKGFAARRPHRSFRVTQRRDYQRSLQLPGYFAFTRHVSKTLWGYRKIFALLALIYAALTVVLVGIGSQESYTTLTSTLSQTGADIFSGNLGQIGQAAILFASIGTTGLTTAPTETQQVFLILLGLMVWLTTVWLLRSLLAGNKVRLRDGIYNAGAPIIPTFLVVLMGIIQLIPIAIAAIGYSAATSTGLLDGGVSAMLFWVAAGLLAVMSLYWISSTFFALVVVTLPGMYPWRALQTAGDMLVGRRLRVLLRILWMSFSVVVGAAIVLIPTILIDGWLVKLWPVVGNIPVVPAASMLVGVCAYIWTVSYVYLLYRKVVEDDAQPA